MIKVLIITTALMCTISAWGSQIAAEISDYYMIKVIDHLDGLELQSKKIRQAEKKARTSQLDVRTAAKSVDTIQKDLSEAFENRNAYPRRIKRDQKTIENKRAESQSIFRKTFPEYSTPGQAIRAVNIDRNLLIEERSILEDRIERKVREFDASLGRARFEANADYENLKRNKDELARVEAKLPQVRRESQAANQAFQKAKKIKEDPALQRRIKQAEKNFREINEERKRQGKNCGGLSPIFPGVCRRFIAARGRLQELRALAAPGSLQPLRQKSNQAKTKLREFRQRQRDLASQTNRLEDILRRSVSRVADLEEDLHIETLPVKSEIAVVNGRLERLNSKLEGAKRLEHLANDIEDFKQRVERNEGRLAALPELIARLEADLVAANQELKRKERISVELNDDLLKEQNLLISQKEELNRLRADMNASLSTVTELLPSGGATPNIDEEIMLSRDWMVITTDLDNEWSRATCRAETTEITEENEGEINSFANLKVVNLVNPSSGFNEPVVVVTVTSSRADLVDFNSIMVSASSSRTYSLDLIYSKSTKNKLFFMADLNDRRGLIDIILKRSSVEMILSNVSSTHSEKITFSLKGSTDALNSSSSQDNSLRNSCGGIDILEI